MEQPRLLIIDDDPEISGYMKTMLTLDAPHFRIDILESARECLEYLKKNEVDCILSDYQMPDMSGMELLETLRSGGSDIPFIFITGQGSEEVAREAFKIGANDYFTKDVGFAHFPRIINSIEQAVKNREDNRQRALMVNALKDSERRYKDLVELSTDFIYRSDRYGNQLFMNDAAYRMLEASPEEVNGQPWQKWIHPEDIKKTIEVFGEMMVKGTDAFNFENRFVSKSGKIIYVMHNVRVLRDEQGTILGTQGIARDITERKLADLALKEAQKEKNAVFHMLTHDIRGPLSVIYGYCDMLKTEGGDTAKIMEEVQKAARRISLLIDDMLAISRLESDDAGLILQPVFALELIEQAVKDCEMFARERQVEIKIEVEPGTPKIYADSAQIRRAVTNLLANAVNYNREGGTALIRAGGVPKDPMKMFIEVSDDGDGIFDEDLPRLFEKYYRGKNAGKKRGTGLGLAMVKAAVDAHGGKVKVSSRRGEGSKFTIILPVKPGIS